MQTDVSVLGIVAARGGSKRVPGKNIAPLLGKPVIHYTIEAAKAAHSLDACIVSTDSQEIADIAKKAGADVPFLRPATLADDTSTDIEYVSHALSWLKQERGWTPNTIVLLPADVPTRTAKDIDATVSFFQDNHFDSVRTLMVPNPPIPYKALYTIEHEKNEAHPLFPQYVGVPMQQLPTVYVSVAVAYILKTDNLQAGSLWGDTVGGFILPENTHVELDEPEHLLQAERVLQ